LLTVVRGFQRTQLLRARRIVFAGRHSFPAVGIDKTRFSEPNSWWQVESRRILQVTIRKLPETLLDIEEIETITTKYPDMRE